MEQSGAKVDGTCSHDGAVRRSVAGAPTCGEKGKEHKTRLGRKEGQEPRADRRHFMVSALYPRGNEKPLK